jgi:hypothetical protein
VASVDHSVVTIVIMLSFKSFPVVPLNNAMALSVAEAGQSTFPRIVILVHAVQSRMIASHMTTAPTGAGSVHDAEIMNHAGTAYITVGNAPHTADRGSGIQSHPIFLTLTATFQY